MTDFGRRVAVGPTTHEELCDALALLTPPGVCLDRATETELCDQLGTLTPPAYCPGGPNILPKTGQSAAYCNYDDGYYEKGWEDTERFTDNEDGTVTDNATGLMWPKDLAGAGVFGIAGLAWLDAIIAAEGSGFAGHQDWRLPNVLELESILSYGAYEPSVYAIFDNVASVYIWSSTTDPSDDVNAITFDGDSGDKKEWNKTWAICMALPVRTA